VHSKPASISVFRRIGRLSVTTRCESFSVFANVLPNVLDEMSPDLPNVQEEPYRDLPNVLYRNLPSVQEPYRNLPNVQDEPYHDLPSVQDEPYPPEYRPHVGAHACRSVSLPTGFYLHAILSLYYACLSTSFLMPILSLNILISPPKTSIMLQFLFILK
jgi:hypothetical protein